MNTPRLISTRSLVRHVRNKPRSPVVTLSRTYHYTPLIRSSPQIGIVPCRIEAMANVRLQSTQSTQAKSGSDIMKERLKEHGFREVVVDSNNCQMRSLADQLFGDQNKHQQVRAEMVKWLSNNEKFKIDDSTVLGDFLDRDEFPKWEDYVKYLSKDSTWGDQLSLVAAAEAFKVTISVLSNVTAPGKYTYITNIEPRKSPSTKTVYLANYHEQHFNSLHKL
eukprot:Phypoly_transcript_15201.p1 GENE.Phypoly_transcript_15201~~Phypoly_transcript_15201.p1  ORF type:complete len:221 (+),score=17.86 Phypoly_transcript_15201:68-730(+)